MWEFIQTYSPELISTGAILVEEGDGIQSHLNFRAVNLAELYLEKSARGIVETVFNFFPTNNI